MGTHRYSLAEMCCQGYGYGQFGGCEERRAKSSFASGRPNVAALGKSGWCLNAV
jgi:hypothetical protein